MDTLIELLQSFPTAIWSVPLGVSIFFWILTILGAFDIEMFDIDTDASPDLEHDIDIGHDHGVHHGFFHGLSESLAIGTVPTTIVLSSISSFGWISSVISELTFAGFARELISPILYGILAFVATFLFAVWITTLVVRPLKPIFHTHTEHGHHYLVGQLAKITSSKVTDNFGLAAIDGKDLILNVICKDQNALTEGDEVSIVSYNEEKNHYIVAPLHEQKSIASNEAHTAASNAHLPGSQSENRTPAELSHHDTPNETPKHTSELE